jgi:3-oxoadipate enol-lactonase/4-carboxymuconolactone decarboxylase
MPYATREGCRLHWKLDGKADRPALLLLNSIGTGMELWDRALPHLLPAFQLLRMDTRGHGASDAPAEDYSMQALAEDAIAVLDAAGIDKAFVAGVSLGGMVAMQLALAEPERVCGLALICTSAKMDSCAWRDRIERVRAGGTAAIADLVMGRFLSPGFIGSDPAIERSLRRGLVEMADDGYAGAGAAIRDMDLLERLPGIRTPTLVVAGEKDISTPFAEHGARIASAVPGARTAHLNCAHLAPVEAPAALAEALRSFFLTKPATAEAEDALYEAGLNNRRRILGDEWVDAALEGRTDFNRDFQAMLTRTAWHEVWGRPGLDDRTRRLLVIAITGSLGRWGEFQLHVRAGLERGGFTAEELKETLMQIAVYAGLPAANHAFSEAGKIIASLERSRSGADDHIGTADRMNDGG